MDNERRRRIEELCDAALDREPGERAAFVAGACAGDAALQHDVESLLAHHRTAEGFLADSAMASVAALMLRSAAPTLVGRTIGVYRFESLLGAGAMGDVYRAHDRKLGRDVAIKILPPHFTNDPERLARFEREARVLATLNHPHIGAIYRLEEADDVRALVLELVEGETLADRIARGPIPLYDALPIARQIAEALEAAHSKGIVHRDLKPANVKITPDGIAESAGLRYCEGSVRGTGNRPNAQGNDCRQWNRCGGHSRHPLVHEPRTGPWSAGRQEDRHLGVRLPALRDARRPASVR